MTMPTIRLPVSARHLLCGLACAGHGLAAETPPPPPRPNIILILCDDLGFGDVGVFFQNGRAALKDRTIPSFTTPHIDTLATSGVRLTQHYSAAPVCAPSRCSLLTGLTQGHANVRDNQFDKALADTHTLGSVLRQAGYATAAIGKWGLQGGGEKGKKGGGDKRATGSMADWSAYPTRRGFDHYFGYVRHVDGHFHYPKEDGRQVWENDREVSADLDLCYTADLFTARAKHWIMAQATTHAQQPFLLYLAYDTPHAKLQNPPCAYPAGGGLRGGVQWTGKPHAMLNTATGSVDGWMHPDYATATWDHDHDASTPEVPWPDVQKRYANDVRRIDDAVGDLLQLLTDLRIADNTLVVFTSDNGPSQESYLKEPYEPDFFRGFGPFDGIKRDTLEGGVRVPALARWPRAIPAGGVVTQASGQWDWLATFADLAGVPAPASSDGVSLVPSLTGRGEQRPGTLYIEYAVTGRTPDYDAFLPAHRGRQRGQMQVVHVDGCKGVRYDIHAPNDPFAIYDLSRDPQEAHDLAQDPLHAGLQARMQARALQTRMADASAPRPYDQALVPPVTMEPTAPAGLNWSSFDGAWPWMPDFRTLTPTRDGAGTDAALTMLVAGRPGGVAFTGFFHAATDGAYTFSLASDTGAMLFLHDIRVIDEPSRDAAGSHAGSIRLKAGWHPLRLYYRHGGTGTARLACTWQMDQDQARALDGSVLRRAH